MPTKKRPAGRNYRKGGGGGGGDSIGKKKIDLVAIANYTV